jgi:hypothetical protein
MSGVWLPEHSRTTSKYFGGNSSVVLVEMLTGRRLFEGATVSDTLAAVLREEIDLGALPAGTPRPLRRLLARCLERDPKQRLRDIGDARADLHEATQPVAEQAVAESTRGPMRAWVPWGLAALAAAIAGWALWNRASAAPAVVADGHFTIELPEAVPLVTLEVPGANEGPIAVSPDGRQRVYVAADGSSTRL